MWIGLRSSSDGTYNLMEKIDTIISTIQGQLPPKIIFTTTSTDPPNVSWTVLAGLNNGGLNNGGAPPLVLPTTGKPSIAPGAGGGVLSSVFLSSNTSGHLGCGGLVMGLVNLLHLAVAVVATSSCGSTKSGANNK